jgi:hypothetical protein
MTRIPSYLLTHRVGLECRRGQSGNGPVYDIKRDIRCRLETIRTWLPGKDGAVATDVSYLLVNADLDVPAQSRVTLPDGRIYTVQGVEDVTGLGGNVCMRKVKVI